MLLDYNRPLQTNQKRICLTRWPWFSRFWGWIIMQTPLVLCCDQSSSVQSRGDRLLFTPLVCTVSPNASSRFFPVVLSLSWWELGFWLLWDPVHTWSLYTNTAVILTLLQYRWRHIGLCWATVQIVIIGAIISFCFCFCFGNLTGNSLNSFLWIFEYMPRSRSRFSTATNLPFCMCWKLFPSPLDCLIHMILVEHA